MYLYLYIVASALFIFGLKRLSKVKTARSGNQMAAVGMLMAIVGVLLEADALDVGWLIAGLAIGAVIGGVLALKVQFTAMPELVAAFNGFGGGASALVATAELFRQGGVSGDLQLAITIPLSVFIGTATLTGSGVAYIKLSGKKVNHPLKGAARNAFHALLVLAIIAVGAWIGTSEASALTLPVIVLVLLSGAVGIFMVTPIGGADMPVVVALLNSFSGVAAATSGFVLNNQMLIVAGALVGASGLILTMIMCKAMNRSLANVLLGGISDDMVAEDAREYQNIKETNAEEVAMLLDAATSCIIIPGYGLAVAQAQHTCGELGELLEKRGCAVRFAIHPVAGRMPGHMNVLLAEADVPYDKLWELERINDDFQNTDMVIIVGANDVVNPIAREPVESPIAGMPILNADYAQTVVMIKRSLSPGYAGIRNPLFDKDNTLMFFSDAKGALQDTVNELKEL